MSAARKLPSGYVQLDLGLLQVDTVVDFDVYIWPQNSPAPVLYRSQDLPFLEENRTRLIEADSGQIFMKKDASGTFHRYIERNLDRIISNPTLPAKAKAKVLYSSSIQLVQDILEKPGATENLKRSEDVVRNTIGYILHGKDAFHQLMSLTSYDYYTYTHSVNVCTIGLALAEQVGMRSQAQLMDFGVGAMFHDVGKTKIPASILRKRGPLSEPEWVEMKRHPEVGLTLLDPQSPFAEDSKAIILQHHERLDGTGYPKGLKEADIHPFAKVAAIVDVFDALTSRRAYKEAIGSYPALKVMKEAVGTHFDGAHFMKFVKLLGK
jgi:HD-GYP domain-containing protein (c-di-GMP phosphodiesterase class II)